MAKAITYRYLIILFLALAYSSCGKLNVSQSGTEPINHAPFSDILQKYVNEEGMVNYKELSKHKDLLESYLTLLRNNIPNDSLWTKEDKLAYWINLYNAFTIKLILDHYPIASIKDIVKGPNLPFVRSPWDLKIIELNGEEYDLNNIEHNILRKLDEPRIHFAIVCASISCPRLRREAYEGETLLAQLEDQTELFLNDTSKNKISANQIRISKIFQWFKQDFTKDGDIISFINPYIDLSIDDNASTDYMDYNWGLNAIPTP